MIYIVDEISLETDDELNDDDINVSNRQPIYGRDTNGSFNRKIIKADLDLFSLIVLKCNDGSVSIMDVLSTLSIEHQLNFISSISYKLKRDPLKTIIYVYASYRDEINRFLNNISTVNGHSFIINGKRLDVAVFNDVVMGSALVDTSLDYNSEDIVNIHFNFIPRPSISPSLNLLDLWERVDTNESLKNAIKGISLRLNVTKRTLHFYGSFILSDQS